MAGWITRLILLMRIRRYFNINDGVTLWAGTQ